MNKLNTAVLAAALSFAPWALLAQNTPKTQPSPSQNQGDIPHQGPGTDNPDVAPENHEGNLPNGKSTKRSTTKRSRQAKQTKPSDTGSTSSPHE
jgi:hypothetical protein